jgi:hypothetical protein
MGNSDTSDRDASGKHETHESEAAAAQERANQNGGEGDDTETNIDTLTKAD